jgi:hypothetical protein
MKKTYITVLHKLTCCKRVKFGGGGINVSEKPLVTFNVRRLIEIIDKHSVYLAQNLQNRCYFWV